jgi:ferredoxin
LQKIELSKSNYFFAVVTYAGDINTTPLQQIHTILSTKSKSLSAGFYILMPNNYIIGYDIHSEERQQKYFKEANNNVEKILKAVENSESNIDEETLEKRRIKSEKFNKDFRDKVYGYDESFYVEDTCTSCGICELVCPVNNIVLEEGKPQWLHKCQQCLACINYCPEKCIQFGESTRKTQRYHHPEIEVEDLLNQKN